MTDLGATRDTVAAQVLSADRQEATLAGQTLANRYDVLELVAIGGMGAVYRARDRELDEIVALKVIRRELASLPVMVERFRHEVKLARRVTHGNVARTFELGIAEGLMFCTMELVEGESLAKRLASHGALSVGEAVAIACAVCDGLAAAHAAGVVHRDIKPANVLLAHDGRVLVADFGVAAIGVAGVDGGSEMSGTPAYMAPEQARGEAATAASDVYAVGVMLYEMLTGRLPFGGDLALVLRAKLDAERISLTSPDVPPALASLIGDATAQSVSARIASAKGLRDALAPWAATVKPAPAAVRRGAITAADISIVVVLAPTGDFDHPRFYLARAVQEQVLARLTTRPRMRVLPRIELPAEGSPIGIGFVVGEALTVQVTLARGAPIEMTFPLAYDQIDAAAETIVALVDGAVARPAERDPRADQAEELLLEARDMAYRDFSRVPEAIVQLEQARELAPQNPRILATLAIGYIRGAFFRPATFRQGVEKARLYANSALVLAPDLAEAHIACGHLELTTKEPERAATHFRIAIGLAPQLPEAHEQLGRMLLEAGYLEPALARLNEAISISPTFRSAKWEIARAHALAGRWEDATALMHSLEQVGLGRPLARARYAWWRGDFATVVEMHASLREAERTLWPGVIDALFDVFINGVPWSAKHALFVDAMAGDIENRRRRVFMAQLAAEAAAYTGAHDSAVELLEQATTDGLFDLHWFDRCPMLDGCRETPGMQRIRERIAARAHAILDALYGDHAVALSETQVA